MRLAGLKTLLVSRMTDFSGTGGGFDAQPMSALPNARKAQIKPFARSLLPASTLVKCFILFPLPIRFLALRGGSVFSSTPAELAVRSGGFGFKLAGLAAAERTGFGFG